MRGQAAHLACKHKILTAFLIVAGVICRGVIAAARTGDERAIAIMLLYSVHPLTASSFAVSIRPSPATPEAELRAGDRVVDDYGVERGPRCESG